MPSTATSILDGLSTSVAVKAPCRTVAISNITLAGLQTISGYTTVENDRVLVKGQANAVDNGIYMASTGNWTRAKDADGNRDLVQGTRVLVRSTTIDGVEYELTTANPIVIGTTALTFELRYGANSNYDQTENEISLGVTPSDRDYPEGDIRRYGALTGSSNDCTTAVQTAMTVANAIRGTMRVPDGEWYCDPGLVLTFDQDRANTGFSIQGNGPGSILRVRGTPDPGFTFIELKGDTPTAAPNDAIIAIRDLTILKTGTKSGSGLTLNNIANFLLDNVMIRGFDTNLYLLSTLVGMVRGSHFTDGNYGVLCRQNGYPGSTGVTAGSTVNLIGFDAGCRFNYNTTWGIDFDNGCGIVIDGDVEANGTSGDANTGGVRIGPALAPDALVATVKMFGWFESNLGTQIKIEAQTGGCLASYEIAPRQLVGSESNRTINIAGAYSAHLHDFTCGPGETFTIVATRSLLQNVAADTINDTADYPVWLNVTTSAGHRAFGRPGSYTGTITGTTGQPAAPTISYIIQGDIVELLLGSGFVATSNTTACTITGMPAAIRPSVLRANVGVCNDSAGAIPANYVIGTDGTITLQALNAGVFSATGFTNSGTKGTATCSIRFKR